MESLVFSDYLVSLNASVKTEGGTEFTGLWGLGERIRDFFYTDGVYTTYANDQGSPIDSGLPPGGNMYGVHPIYLGKTSNMTYFGVFNLNSNPADFWIRNNKTSGLVSINQVSTGGIVDLYFISASNPNRVVEKYH